MADEKICQSCGMPMSKETDFGTNLDGGISKDYCTFCYQDGSFTDEGITMEEKIEKLVYVAVRQLGMNADEARKMAKETLPHLKRWKK